MKDALKLNIALFLFTIIFAVGCKWEDKNKVGSTDILNKPPYAALTDSIKRFPKDAFLYFRRAELLSENNLHETANADYSKSWGLKPDEQTGIRYASNLAILGKAGDHIRLLQTCIEQFPQQPGFKRLLGEAYVQEGKIKQAIGLYNRVLKNDSANFEAWYEKGRLLAQAKDTAGAILALQNAYSIQPVATYALELAHLYAESSNAIALRICDNVLQSDSSHELIDPFFIKGIYYSNTKKYELARMQFDSCISRDWKFTQAYIEKGIALFKQKNYDAALNTFRMAATVTSTDPDAYFWMGRCYEAVNKKHEAAEYYERAFELDKNFSEAKEALQRVSS
ncbi:MAG TPA: tetratricopeptide repeat protein [Puia sp.]|nr:tetratricopeptide repeat protein [Puia sp.]